MTHVTRFAPSPTGYLHLGHAFAALFAAEAAGEIGRFLVRIEDIDEGRAKPEFERAIDEDLEWLGLAWERPVRRQSEHRAEYAAALETLKRKGVVYPCFCTRAEIAAEIAASAAAPQGPDGPLYPGTCRHLSIEARREKEAAGVPFAWRIDAAKARGIAGRDLSFVEEGLSATGAVGRIGATPELLGDVVIARKDAGASYHLAVVVDDAAQGVTLVTRGVDLFPATHMHRLLQALLALPVPAYRHHKLITDASGKRLAKRDHATALRTLRLEGATANDIRSTLGFASVE